MQIIIDRIKELEDQAIKLNNALVANQIPGSGRKIERDLRGALEILKLNKELLLKIGSDDATIYH